MSNKQNILIRADSSSIIGTGHIMRTLVLAIKYKNSNITFASQNLKGNINDKILDEGYKLEILKSNNIEELIKLIYKLKIDFIIIDSYDIHYKFEKQLKEKTNIKILSFDDTYEKHYCDILLNHNISANKNKYKGLIPKNCELRCGSKYTLLRDEFIKEKDKIYKKNKKIKKIFIAIGGADTSNINIKILKIIKKLKNIQVNIVTTKANENLKKLELYCNNKSYINLHVNSKKIAKLMNKSDFAIVTPSVILNEIYYLNIPFIAIKTAPNQKDMYEYLKSQHHLYLKKFNKDKLILNINKILENKNEK